MITMSEWAWRVAVYVFTQSWGFFTRILTATGMMPTYITMFFIMVVFRLLVVPLVGHSVGGSDKADPKNNKQETEAD